MNHHMDKATEERLRVEAWVGAAYAWIEHHLKPRMEERWHTLRRKALR